MELPFIISVYHFWKGFQIIFKFGTFRPFLQCKIAILKKNYQQWKELSYRENKVCFETIKAVGTTWEHAQLGKASK